MPTPVHTIYVLKVVSNLRCHIDTKEETTPTRRVFTKFTKVSPDPCHLTIQKVWSRPLFNPFYNNEIIYVNKK